MQSTYNQGWILKARSHCDDCGYGMVSNRPRSGEMPDFTLLLGNELIEPAGAPIAEGEVECDERLGGLLQHYRRAA